jgi:amidophosphoribosyltransferase
MDIDAMRDYIHADSLAFVSIDGLYHACLLPEGRNNQQPQYCDACFSGDYPTHLTDQENDRDQELALFVAP